MLKQSKESLSFRFFYQKALHKFSVNFRHPYLTPLPQEIPQRAEMKYI